MSNLVYIVSFLLLIGSIALSRTRLVREIEGIGLLLVGSRNSGLIFYSLITLPGTILHELSHWLVAELLGVRTGEITIFPDLDRAETRETNLGSVKTASSGPFRAFLIGLAPFVTGLISLVVMGYFLELGWGVYPTWQLALLIYGLIVVSNSMLISKSDRRTWPFILAFSSILVVALYLAHITVPQGYTMTVIKVLARINYIMGVTLGLNLAMIALFYLSRRILEKVTNKRIVRR